jgi:hypothetical protein
MRTYKYQTTDVTAKVFNYDNAFLLSLFLIAVKHLKDGKRVCEMNLQILKNF